MEKERRLKEIGFGWIGVGIILTGSMILSNFDWRVLLGVGLIITPFAYVIDVIRNYLRDF